MKYLLDKLCDKEISYSNFYLLLMKSSKRDSIENLEVVVTQSYFSIALALLKSTIIRLMTSTFQLAISNVMNQTTVLIFSLQLILMLLETLLIMY